MVTHTCGVEKPGDTWQIVEEEMKKQGLVEDRSKICFELYDRFKFGSPESEIFVYAPIKE